MLEALSYGFMQKALVSGAAVAAVCALAGLFLVLRRYSLFGDGISHVAFGGVAAGLFLGVLPLWTALAAAVAGGLGLQKLRSSARISGDAATAVMLAAGLAAGVTLVSASGGFSVDVMGFLFGSILLVGDWDAAAMVAVSAAAAAALLAMRGRLAQVAFNEELARLSGVNVALTNYLFVVIASVVVVTSMRLVGILLISALIVIPNVTAMMLGRGLAQTAAVSVSLARGRGGLRHAAVLLPRPRPLGDHSPAVAGRHARRGRAAPRAPRPPPPPRAGEGPARGGGGLDLGLASSSTTSRNLSLLLLISLRGYSSTLYTACSWNDGGITPPDVTSCSTT